MTDTMKMVSGGLAAGAVVLLALTMFLPWQSQGTDGFEANANLWTMSFEFFGESDSMSWYDSDFDDGDGITMLRIGAPVVTLGLVMAAVGAIMSFTGRGNTGATNSLVAGVITVLGTIFVAIGLTSGEGESGDWAASFFLAITACVLLIVAGVMGMMKPAPVRR